MADERQTRKLTCLLAGAGLASAAASDVLILLRLSSGLEWLLAGSAAACWLYATRSSLAAKVAACVIAAGHGLFLAWKVMGGAEAFFGVTVDPVVTACVWLAAAGVFATLILFALAARRFSG